MKASVNLICGWWKLAFLDLSDLTKEFCRGNQGMSQCNKRTWRKLILNNGRKGSVSVGRAMLKREHNPFVKCLYLIVSALSFLPFQFPWDWMLCRNFLTQEKGTCWNIYRCSFLQRAPCWRMWWLVQMGWGRWRWTPYPWKWKADVNENQSKYMKNPQDNF